MDQPLDEVPAVTLVDRSQKFVDIHIVGDAPVEMLDDLVSEMKGISDPKGAVLRMIGIFHVARGATILVQRENEDPRVVEGVWDR